MTEIVTRHENPPIPDRKNDWCAYRKGREETGPYGWGATEEAAINDLHGLEDKEPVRGYFFTHADCPECNEPGEYEGDKKQETVHCTACGHDFLIGDVF